MKLLKRTLWIVCFVLIAAVVLLTAIIGVRRHRLSSYQQPATLREWIGIPDSPDAVARKWMDACIAGNAVELISLISQERLNRFFNRAALSDPPMTPEQALNSFAKEQQNRFRNCDFEISRMPEKTERDLLYFSVKVLETDKPATTFTLDLQRDSDGFWKCSGGSLVQ